MSTGQPGHKSLSAFNSIFDEPDSKTKALIHDLSLQAQGTDSLPLELLWGLSRAPGAEDVETHTATFAIKAIPERDTTQGIPSVYEYIADYATEGSRFLGAAIDCMQLDPIDATQCLEASLRAFCELFRFQFGTGKLPSHLESPAALSSIHGQVEMSPSWMRMREMSAAEVEEAKNAEPLSYLATMLHIATASLDVDQASREDFGKLSRLSLSSRVQLIVDLKSLGWSDAKANAGLLMNPLMTDLFLKYATLRETDFTGLAPERWFTSLGLTESGR